VEAGYERVFRRVRADMPDVVSIHANEPGVFFLADGLPALYTLHVAPKPLLVEAALHCRAWFTAPSDFLASVWRAAGIERIHVIHPGVADFPLPPAVVRPLALVADRTSAVAALRAGLGITMLGTLGGAREDLSRRLAHSAVCVAATDDRATFNWIAAQAQLAGCPVVGYAEGALTEMVEDGVSGLLVRPDDEPALTAAVRRSLGLDRRAVRESARARFGLAPMVDRYESELRAIARRSAVRLVA
jgi:glycosyltransferase involved in cell wall biosynthesis